MWVEGPFCITVILQTTWVFASKMFPTQLTKPVNARENCSCCVKTVPAVWKLEVCRWKLVPAMGMYLPNKYKHQFYRSRPIPYSGKAVNKHEENHLKYLVCLNNILPEHYKTLCESYMSQIPLPTAWSTFLFFIIIKHAHHGAHSTAYLPGHMWNRSHALVALGWAENLMLTMEPILQPYFKDTCGIGSRAFAALGWVESWFGIDQVEMEWSPPNCFYLYPFLLPHPPKSSLSLIQSSRNCRQ